MRWARTGTVLGVIGLVLLGAGWWLTGVGAAGPARPVMGAAATRWPVMQRPPAPLLRQLQLYLASTGWQPTPRRPAVPVLRAPRSGPSVQGSTCFVAGGFCSITPCTVPVATARAPGCRAAAAPSRALVVSGATAASSPATFRLTSP